MTTPSDDDNVPMEHVASKLRETGNGPTIENEAEILRSIYGNPNDNGVYGAAEVNE